jgi:phage terminase large subunit-like protein
MARRAESFKSLGFQVIAWIETFLVHGPGDVEGQLIELDDEFAAFIVKAYQVRARDGRRIKRRVALSRPKGRAKSELAAMLACAEGLGPVRFDHWAAEGEVSSWGYEYEAGEPVGVPVRRPIIRCFATELGQAGNTYDAIYYMLHPETASPNLVRAYGRVDVGITRINLPHGGEMTPESARDTSKDGGKETFVVFDESHLWVLPGLHRLHQTVVRNLLKRKLADPWSLETTTMFAPGENSVAENTFKYASMVQRGDLKGAVHDLLLFDHREASAKWDIEKLNDRVAGLREVYGPAATWMPVREIAASFDDPQTSPAEWERYWWNRPRSLQGSWLKQADWDVASDKRPIPDFADVVLALDGSYNGDATALVAVQVDDPMHVVVAGLWERPPGVPGWTVPVLEVEDHIKELCTKWRVLEVAADPYRWQRSLEVLATEGVPVEAFPQSAARMTPATSAIADLLSVRGLTHDGDERLARHISNAVLAHDSRGSRLRKETKTSDRRIDLAVAMVMAVSRAAWHRNNSVEYDIALSIY